MSGLSTAGRLVNSRPCIPDSCEYRHSLTSRRPKSFVRASLAENCTTTTLAYMKKTLLQPGQVCGLRLPAISGPREAIAESRPSRPVCRQSTGRESNLGFRLPHARKPWRRCRQRRDLDRAESPTERSTWRQREFRGVPLSAFWPSALEVQGSGVAAVRLTSGV